MKTELKYLKLAFEEYCLKNRWDKGLPITPSVTEWVVILLFDGAEVLVIADRLRTADKKATETA